MTGLFAHSVPNCSDPVRYTISLLSYHQCHYPSLHPIHPHRLYPLLHVYMYASFPSAIHSTLKMEAARSSKMMVSYHITTQCQNQENYDLKLTKIS